MKQPSSNGSNGHNGNGISIGNGIDDVVIPKKPIQKVIPSRNTELMSSQALKSSPTSSPEANGANCLGYVKPHSPLKNGIGVLTNSNNNSSSSSSNKFNTSNGGAATSSVIKSPVSATSKLGTVKTHRTVTWNHDIPTEKLSFTMRREFDRHREEIELMSQLRIVSVLIWKQSYKLNKYLLFSCRSLRHVWRWRCRRTLQMLLLTASFFAIWPTMCGLVLWPAFMCHRLVW